MSHKLWNMFRNCDCRFLGSIIDSGLRYQILHENRNIYKCSESRLQRNTLIDKISYIKTDSTHFVATSVGTCDIIRILP